MRFAFAGVLLLAVPASAEVCKGSKVPKAELRRYDAKPALAMCGSIS